jgi:SIT family siderophore-iron:H+ symporter-like MFS transporter
MQAATKHERMALSPPIVPNFFLIHSIYTNPASIDVAVIISLCFAAEYIGGALGNTIASAIWNQVLPSQLAVNLGNTTEALAVFADPFSYAAIYRPGTPQRDAIAMSYGYVQKLMCIVGIGLCILQIAFACVIRNPVLGKEQSLPDAEESNREGLELEMKPPWHTRFFN